MTESCVLNNRYCIDAIQTILWLSWGEWAFHEVNKQLIYGAITKLGTHLHDLQWSNSFSVQLSSASWQRMTTHGETAEIMWLWLSQTAEWMLATENTDMWKLGIYLAVILIFYVMSCSKSFFLVNAVYRKQCSQCWCSCVEILVMLPAKFHVVSRLLTV